MHIPNWLRRIRYNSALLNLVKAIRVYKPLRRFYYKIAIPGGRKIEVSLFGIKAMFYAENIQELAWIESVFFDKREKEASVIKRISDFLKPGDNVYDVGASIGTHTVFLAKKVGESGRVVAFEPELRSFNRLKDNVSLNNLKNVLLVNSALGDRKKRTLLCGHGKDYECALFELQEGTKTLIPTGEVDVAPGDVLVHEMDLPSPKAIKIDVEGYEYYVLLGLKNTINNTGCRMVSCEIHPYLYRDFTLDDIIQFLKSSGFKRIDIVERNKKTSHVFCYK